MACRNRIFTQLSRQARQQVFGDEYHHITEMWVTSLSKTLLKQPCHTRHDPPGSQDHITDSSLYVKSLNSTFHIPCDVPKATMDYDRFDKVDIYS
jgi:hypothetical protein